MSANVAISYDVKGPDATPGPEFAIKPSLLGHRCARMGCFIYILFNIDPCAYFTHNEYTILLTFYWNGLKETVHLPNM